MTHYICTGGCQGLSDKPGKCGAKNCPKYSKPLEKCECKNGNMVECLRSKRVFNQA